MTNILFISFEFPPLVRGGVYRSLAFVQYLPEFGINPIVVTLDQKSYADTFDVYGVDEKLGEAVHENRTIVPVLADKAESGTKLGNFFSIYFSILGNDVKYWKKGFYEAVDEVVKKYSPKAIFVTVPPFGALELAQQVSKKYKLPLLTDFRDAFSQWRAVPFGSYLHYLRTLQVEKKYLEASNAIIATSRQTMDDFKRIHPKIPDINFCYIPNGYSGTLNQWKSIDANKDEFVIGYVGSFYYSPETREQMFESRWKKKGHRIFQYIPAKQDWLYRSPYFFFKVLQELNKKAPALAKKIKVKFAGKKHAWLADMIRTFDLQEQITLLGEVPHHQSLAFQEQCDALFITSAKQIGGRDYSIAGKTFEYLQMQRPVIAFVCDGAQKDLLSESGTSLICDPDDTQSSVSKLINLFEGKLTFSPNYPLLKKLTRRELTGQLATLITRTIERF